MATANAEDVAKRLREAVARWDRDHLKRYLAMLDPSFEIDDPTFRSRARMLYADSTRDSCRPSLTWHSKF